MYTAKLYVDTREGKVLPYIKKVFTLEPTFLSQSNEILYEEMGLSQGDYQISILNKNDNSEVPIAVFDRIKLDDYLKPKIPLLTIDEERYYIDNEYEVQFESKCLEQGDYIITVQNKINDTASHSDTIGKNIPVSIIERKSLKDYGASLKDGRHLNRDKLLEFRRVTGAKIYYIIEGKKKPNLNSRFAGIRYAQIKRSISNLIKNYDIHVIYSANPEETAQELKFLTETYASDQEYLDKFFNNNNLDQTNTDLANTITTNDTINSISGGNEVKNYLDIDEAIIKSKLSPEQQNIKDIIKIWSNIRGISNNSAQVLHVRFSLADWILDNITNEDVKDLKLPSGTSFTMKIKTLLSKPPDIENEHKILSAIPSISITMSKKILSQISLNEMCKHLQNDDYTKFKNIYKNDKCKIGKPCVKKIKFYLFSKNLFK